MNTREAIRNPALISVLIVGLVWAVAGMGDWVMRFRWFQWHKTWMVSQSTVFEEGVRAPREVPRPSRLGGDLTRLIAIPAVEQLYAVERPAAVFWADEYGYQNEPPVTNKAFPIVVAGDSYMHDGVTMTDTMSGQLAALSGVGVYNHALAGWGSFLSVVRFLQSARFRERPPRFLVFGIIEREVEGRYFEGLTYQLYRMTHGKEQGRAGRLFDARRISPSELRKALPDTSIMAQMAARYWARLRYYGLGRLMPHVIPAKGDGERRGMLLYYPSIDAMKWPASRRDVEKVAGALHYLDNICRERNIILVVVLIPDKEQVHRDWIPARFEPIPPSCLDPLAAALQAKDIKVVNLLPVFTERSRQGVELYWPDDTHWNPAGIRVAAERVWALLGELP